MRWESRTVIDGGGSVDGQVEEGRPVVAAALVNLLSRSEALRPFAILEDIHTGKFVQWCGSATRSLRFEAPAIDLVELRGQDVLGATERAFQVLRQLCPGAQPFPEGLLLTESDTFDAGQVLPSALTRPN